MREDLEFNTEHSKQHAEVTVMPNTSTSYMLTAPRVEGTRAEKRLPGPEILFLQDIFNAIVSIPGLTRTIKGGRLPRSCQWKKKKKSKNSTSSAHLCLSPRGRRGKTAWTAGPAIRKQLTFKDNALIIFPSTLNKSDLYFLKEQCSFCGYF